MKRNFVSSNLAMALVAGATACIVIALLCSFTLNWTHWEIYAFVEPGALVPGASIGSLFPFQSFDWVVLDGYERTRFLSNFSNALNVKLRLLMSQYAVLHPSVSIIWPLLLVATPILLYRAVNNLTESRVSGFIAATLIVCSSGLLSGVLMLFHMGKPLSLFFGVVLLFLLSVLVKRQQEEELLARKDTGLYALAFIVLLALFSSDESGIVIAAGVSCFALHIARSKRGAIIYLLGGASVVAFALWSFLIAPMVVDAAGYGPFDVVAASTRLKAGAPQFAGFLYSPGMLFWNYGVFLGDAILPGHLYLTKMLGPPSAYMPWMDQVMNGGASWPVPARFNTGYLILAISMFGAIVFLSLALMALKIKGRLRIVFFESVACFLLAGAGLTLLNQHYLLSSHYYGAVMALPVSVMIGCLFTESKRIAPAVVFAMLCAAGIINAVQGDLLWRTQGGFNLAAGERHSRAELQAIWGGSATEWKWAQAHRETNYAAVHIRRIEEFLSAQGIDRNKVRIAYLAKEPPTPGVRDGFMTILFGNELYDKGDLKFLMRERCELCIRVSSGGVQWVELRSERARALNLPPELLDKVREQTSPDPI